MVVFEHLDEQEPEDDPVIPRAADDLGPDRAKASVREPSGSWVVALCAYP
jgi:hypothetical protein